MGTTSPTLPLLLLQSITNAGHRCVLLHGVDDLKAGTVQSDLDVAVAASPMTVIRDIQQLLRPKSILLIFVWYSDRGTVNTFWWDEAASSGAQLDLLWDAAGRNRFGIKTTELWHHTVQGEDFEVLTPGASFTYSVAKRLGKGQTERLGRLLTEDDTPLLQLMLARRTRTLLRLRRIPALVSTYGLATNLASRLLRLPARMHPQGSVVPYVDTPRSVAEVEAMTRVLPRTSIRSSVETDGAVARLRLRVLPLVVFVSVSRADAQASLRPAHLLAARAEERLDALSLAREFR